ncbi:right-handed parallel beta-helix repeat-containing protein [Paenibacillus sp. 2TAB23]|uniref:alpha-1,3-galactosidase-related protein n=1 Tax=Paenibacillus sp. 2TAB23 TaxID=3233004 RepID=UPI003F9E32D3
MAAASVNDSSTVKLEFAQFGGKPDSGEDAVPAMKRAIEAASRISGTAVTLVVEPGRYDFYAESAERAVYYMSNTASETENPNPVKTIGICLKGLNNFVLDGGGALFLFHGKMTMLVIDDCERIEICNLKLDYAWPTVVEMKVEKTVENADTGAYLDICVHSDSRYEIREGLLCWIGDGWRFRDGPMQVFDKASNSTWRIANVIKQALRAEELNPGRIRLHYELLPDIAEGWILQARDGIRDQAGAFIHRSRDIHLERIDVHFMHGLGIVGQFSDNLSFNRLDMSPRPETGRTVAAFADFVHLSGCKGRIFIKNSRFVGAHDDAINVHGTHLRIVGFPSANQVLVRFMHPQTYGFEAFHAGDDIEWIKERSLVSSGSTRVMDAKLIEPRVMLLTLEASPPEGIEEGDVVENATWTPEVEIMDNYFARIPTRGVLATTRKRTVIARNVFERMRMSAVLVADDAASWYESGRVEDLLIRENGFIECGSSELAVISIVPENEEIDPESPVHRNIRIEENLFLMSQARLLDAKCAHTLSFRNNVVLTVPGFERITEVNEGIRLTACTDVEIFNNSLGAI